jgi:hypothetical protein
MVRNKLKTNEFIERAINKHGDLYDYSETVYETSKKKVQIICQEHGAFEQSPNSHLAGAGCLKCGEKKRGKRGPHSKPPRPRATTQQFIAKAVRKFGDLFDYSETEYSCSTEPVTIICKTHGRFTQSPSNHFNSVYACPKCFLELSEKTRRSEFFESPKERRGFLINKMREIKEQTPCKDCGLNYPHYVLDFDHVNGEKIGCLSDLCSHGFSWDKIQAEIDKCEVVCSNCHRTRHWIKSRKK